ncbi:MAG: hypothetical protein R3F62_07690 [Planctomycetota bacterium]
MSEQAPGDNQRPESVDAQAAPEPVETQPADGEVADPQPTEVEADPATLAAAAAAEANAEAEALAREQATEDAVEALVVAPRPTPPPAEPLPASPGAPGVEAGAPGPAPAPQVQRLDAESGVDESWFGNFFDWVRTHPMLALVMFCVVFVGPFAVNHWHQNRVKAQLVEALDVWQGQLQEAGLPIPFVPPKDLPQPQGFPQAPDELFRWAGLLQRKETLSAWRVRLGGAAPAAPPQGDDPWAAAVRVCLQLHRAEAGDAVALGGLDRDLDLSPADVRPVLELTKRLIQGERSVGGRASELLQDPPPGCERPLRALLYEAQRREIERTLAGRPPVRRDVEALARLAKAKALALPDALAEAGEGLLGVLEPGDGDLARAAALIETFEVLRETPAGERLGSSWAVVRAGVGRVLAAHWADPQAPIGPALELFEALRAADPAADVPLSALDGWRRQLQAVVNDPRQLGVLAQKLLELGFLPRTLEAVLGDAEVPRGETPGLRLFRALQASLAFERGEGEPPPATLWSEVEASLAGREDALARRILAQCAFRGAVEARLQGRPTAGHVLSARTRGYAPAYRLLAEEAQGLEGEAASQALSAALEDLARESELPEARLRLEPARAHALEAEGRPTSLDAYAVERSQLLALASGFALAAGQEAEAAAHAAQAVSAARTASAFEALARVERARGRVPQAFQAVRQGLDAGPTPRERARLEALQTELTPR